MLAPQEELELVRRICDLYAGTRLSFKDIARLGSVEGWRDHQGRLLTDRAIATLVRDEALIGNFVWGRKKHATCIVQRDPSRHDGYIPRLIDDDTWTLVQRRTEKEISRKQTDEIAVKLRRALQRSPLLVTRDFRAQGLPAMKTIRARLGAWPECLEQAGQDPSAVRKPIVDRARQHRENGRELGTAIVWKLGEDGHRVSFDGRSNVLYFPEFRMRLRLLWPTLGEVGKAWRIRVERVSREVDFDLVVRMEDRFRPKDFFVASPQMLWSDFRSGLLSRYQLSWSASGAAHQNNFLNASGR